MSDHFAAFSFVDRITGSRRRAREAPSRFPRASGPSRLASWRKRWGSSRRGSRWRTSAFAAGRWRRSPTRRASCAPLAPATRSTLAVEIERLRRRGGGVSRHAPISTACARSSSPTAWARCCRVAEFDDPAAMAERFALLVRGGAPPGRFRGVDRRGPCAAARAAAESREALLDVPACGAVLQRSLSAPRGVSRDADARRADRARAGARPRVAGIGTPERARRRCA